MMDFSREMLLITIAESRFRKKQARFFPSVGTKN